MSKKTMAGIGVLILLVIISVSAAARPGQIDRGGEWLSWSPQQRATYVDGFISGYLQGSHRACDDADELFEVGKMHRLGHGQYPGEMPSARCLARVETYSKTRYTETSGPDFSAYSGVITEFYTRYPQYGGIPFVNLMKALSDRNHRTSSQLYQMALQGQLRPLR